MGVSSVGVSRLENKSFVTGDIRKVGMDIFGGSGGERSGYSVSISADGTTVAVGAWEYSSTRGITRIYRYDGSTWSPLGDTIVGGSSGERSGWSVSISADGTTVAIGAYDFNVTRGVTRVFRYQSGGAWPQLGQNILGDGGQEGCGYSVSISADGKIVAVGAFRSNGLRGVTRVYYYEPGAGSGTWLQRGQSIVGDGTEEYFGYSVSLSADANTLAVGAPSNSNQQGVTRVYRYNATTGQWYQLTPTISGVDYGEYSSESLSLSADGTTVAVGAYANNGHRGVTRVYRYNGYSDWPRLGQNIVGDGTDEYSGRSVSISADGTTVAVGAIQNRNATGATRLYKYDALTGQWSQLGSTIFGAEQFENFGMSVSLSANGTTVAIGAPYNNNLRGATRVYSLADLLNYIYGLAFVMRIS